MPSPNSPSIRNILTAGTVYFAELEEPLDFGTEPLTPEIAASINMPPPTGSSVHVRLMTGAELSDRHRRAMTSRRSFRNHCLTETAWSCLREAD